MEHREESDASVSALSDYNVRLQRQNVRYGLGSLYTRTPVKLLTDKVNVRVMVMQGLSKRRRDDGTLAIDCPGKDYRIGTLSKVNNIIYCKNDVLAE